MDNTSMHLGIYHLERLDQTDYDEQRAVVVVAANDLRAREIAAICAGNEGSDRWLTDRVKCLRIGTADSGLYESQETLICRDFVHG